LIGVESQLLSASNGDYIDRKWLSGTKSEKLNKKRQLPHRMASQGNPLPTLDQHLLFVPAFSELFRNVLANLKQQRLLFLRECSSELDRIPIPRVQPSSHSSQ
jgi:hypothetical protein